MPGMFEDRGDSLLVAVHDVEHAVGHPGFREQVGDEQRRRRVLLGRLEDERVAARDARSTTIQSGTITGKLNGVMPATTPSGWRIEYTSMPVDTCSL